MVPLVGARAAVLVEGASDQAALESLAVRLGRDLAAEGVHVLPMGGATEIRRFVQMLAAAGDGMALAGLCDAGEAGYFVRALDRAHVDGSGFFVCHADLEEELIRAVGARAVIEVIETQGELRSWLRFTKQPAQRTREVDEQLHRFMGTRSGRKAQYAAALVDALDLARVPAPLAGVLAFTAR
ncbi:MAG: ATP-dependent endonuclease [Nocardioidaceae bacterium]|nr:ATP-dependent endonuclease [Nocardioidaceae bacterium]NUS52469.1 ATP-dependent endonuclease [Nocardioidaceae bacterium]